MIEDWIGMALAGATGLYGLAIVLVYVMLLFGILLALL